MSVGDGTLQPQVTAAGTNGDPSVPFGNLPALRNHIPDREVVPRQLDGDGLGFSGIEEDCIEALQVVRRLVRRGGWGGVQLYDLSARLRSGIRDRKRDVNDGIVEPDHE